MHATCVNQSFAKVIHSTLKLSQKTFIVLKHNIIRTRITHHSKKIRVKDEK